jgi:hypothetical protein
VPGVRCADPDAPEADAAAAVAATISMRILRH